MVFQSLCALHVDEVKDIMMLIIPNIHCCAHNLQELRRSASLATKVFIQRDYSDGTICQFQTKFPPELDSRIERQLFEETVKTLNGFYAEAEKIGGSSYLEGCLACATAYFIFLCMETHYEKVLKKISRYIQEQNEKVFAPRGLLLTDPVERGMRVIEISIYEDRCSSGSSSSGSSSGKKPAGSSTGGPRRLLRRVLPTLRKAHVRGNRGLQKREAPPRGRNAHCTQEWKVLDRATQSSLYNVPGNETGSNGVYTGLPPAGEGQMQPHQPGSVLLALPPYSGLSRDLHSDFESQLHFKVQA
ncbi:golgin subfamily A member 7B [Tupaia chinensis]|uniref:golgin subfamily A member 7B n=1 Tax=Tupaia chinensis TaxID=246437 RepID=UPI0003C907CF|nr:golgin subfamily A member 7B [Tupaia chinensis]